MGDGSRLWEGVKGWRRILQEMLVGSPILFDKLIRLSGGPRRNSLNREEEERRFKLCQTMQKKPLWRRRKTLTREEIKFDSRDYSGGKKIELNRCFWGMIPIWKREKKDAKQW